MDRKKMTLSLWDWSTLIASWRYYEGFESDEGSAFPARIVNRFFTGDYEEDECHRIARQFAEVDHGLAGESDWTDDRPWLSGDKHAWCKFFAFCKGYHAGFRTVVMEGDCEGASFHEEAKGFYCEYTGQWYRVKDYIAHPDMELVCAKKFIKEVK